MCCLNLASIGPTVCRHRPRLLGFSKLFDACRRWAKQHSAEFGPGCPTLVGFGPSRSMLGGFGQNMAHIGKKNSLTSIGWTWPTVCLGSFVVQVRPNSAGIGQHPAKIGTRVAETRPSLSEVWPMLSEFGRNRPMCCPNWRHIRRMLAEFGQNLAKARLRGQLARQLLRNVWTTPERVGFFGGDFPGRMARNCFATFGELEYPRHSRPRRDRRHRTPK